MLILVIAMIIVGVRTEVSDVTRSCLENHNVTLSSDYLVGTWYHIYHFSWFSNLPPSCSCSKHQFKKPSEATIAAYKAKYNDPELPYSFDDDPVQTRTKHWQGMLAGKTRAKFYVLSPKSTSRLQDGYEVMNYKPLNDKFMIMSRCAMRGNTLELMTRDRNTTIEELNELIKNTPEFDRMESQRFCAVNKYCLHLNLSE